MLSVCRSKARGGPAPAIMQRPAFRPRRALRRRLRQVRRKEWKSTAAKRHNLRIRGISESNARKWAGSSKGHWRVAGSKVLQVSLPNAYWNRPAC